MHLLQYFDKLSLEPRNSEKIKDFFIDFALRGRLTEAWRKVNPNVEPAAILLERIKEQKERFIRQNKIKREKVFAEISQEDIPFSVPEKWKWIRLIQSCHKIHYGFNASAQKNNDGIRLLRITDIQDNKVNWETVPSCNCKQTDFLKFGLSENDILIARTGGTIGKSYIVKGLNVDSLFASYLIRLVPSNEVDADYLKKFTESGYYWAQINNASSGTGQPNVSGSKLKEMILPLPPVEEQKAIVKIINQLMREVERLELQTKTRVQLSQDYIQSSLYQLTAKDSPNTGRNLKIQNAPFFDTAKSVNSLREAILQLAVQGKLTRRWRKENPNVESAFILIENIKKAKDQLVKEKKIKKKKPLPEITNEDMPFELPRGWAWFRFQELFDIRDGTHDSPKDTLDVESYPLITSKNFKNGTIDFDSARRISKEDYLKVVKRSQVHRGDILFSIIGGNIGNQVEVGKFTEFAIKNVALFKHYEYGKPIPGFLKLLSQYLAMNLQTQAVGGAQPFISLKYLRNVVFALPPLEEQVILIQTVFRLLGYCDQLKVKIERRNTLSKDFLQSSIREVMEHAKILV